MPTLLPPTPQSLTLVLQAGGRSSRMGYDKGLALLGGVPLVQHILRRFAQFPVSKLLITNQPENYRWLGLAIVSDAQPGAGALEGLQTALQAAQTEWLAMVACDMPFASPRLFSALWNFSENNAVVIPSWQGELQPMHALYRRTPCLQAVNSALARGEKRLVAFHHAVQVCEISQDFLENIDIHGECFFNINTPANLEQGEALLAQLNTTVL